MSFDFSRAKDLLGRINSSNRNGFPGACTSLYAYLDDQVYNNVFYQEFEAERISKWANWGPLPTRMAVWSMPESEDDRVSLSYDLFRTVAERGDKGDQLLNTMYVQDCQDNIDSFRKDFFPYLKDAVRRIASIEPDASRAAKRKKADKFGILDAPQLLENDLSIPPGLLGRVLVYFDIDNFKQFNSRFTESVVDDKILKDLQSLVNDASLNIGYAYAEGGDEMIVLLQNSTLTMGASFAEALRQLIEDKEFVVNGESVNLKASFGVAESELAT